MKIFAIIVTYNAMPWIDRCLHSLAASSVPVQAVVVDNCSKDETVAHIRANYPDATLFAQEQNLGFGQGNNVGIRHAMQQGCDYVLLLNQDAWIDADMLATLLPYDDGKTLLSPVHLNGAHTQLDFFFGRNTVIRNGYKPLLDNDPLLAKASGIHPSDEICAACWLLSRAILENIGGFNPLFFHYNEDNNYQHRLFYHQYVVAWVGGCYVCHDREYRADPPIKYFRVRQDLLLRSTDINHSRVKGFLLQIRYGLATLHTSLVRRDFTGFRYFLKAAWDLATHDFGAVARSRKAERKLQPNWL